MPQPIEDGEADLLAGELDALQSQCLLDLDPEGLEPLVGDRPVLARRPETGDDLGPIERLALTRPLHHHERRLLHPLERGETTSALEAFAAPADGAAVVGQTRVDDLVIDARAAGAAHARRYLRHGRSRQRRLRQGDALAHLDAGAAVGLGEPL